jgi:excisionase family DNA binding protein
MASEQGLQKILYKVPEVAEMLSLGPSTVYEMIERGELKGTRIGRSVRVSASAIADWAERAAEVP